MTISPLGLALLLWLWPGCVIALTVHVAGDMPWPEAIVNSGLGWPFALVISAVKAYRKRKPRRRR